MNRAQQKKIETTLTELFNDSKNDHFRMMKAVAKSVFGRIQPSDFKEVYLSISKEQGEDLVKLIKKYQLRNIVEFGTSFGISTLYLAQGIIATKGQIITTELVKSKAEKAIENFQKAGVSDLIDVRIGDALMTLSNYQEPIDLLLLDGWKDLYLPLFKMLEHNYHENTVIYVDNADMSETQPFLKRIRNNPKYNLVSKFQEKVVLITLNKV